MNMSTPFQDLFSCLIDDFQFIDRLCRIHTVILLAVYLCGN